MPTTAGHALPYPAPTDPADVPADMQKLAAAVDTALLPTDTVVAAATRIIRNLLLAGDAQAAWQVRGDGQMQWGAGGASALDVNLYRRATNALKTDGGFEAGWDVVARQGGAEARLGTVSTSYPGIALGTTPGDTFLYRSASGILQADGEIGAAWNLRARKGSSFAVMIGLVSSGYPGIAFGSGDGDTFLYRAAAGLTQTDTNLKVIGWLQCNGQYRVPPVAGAVGGVINWKFPVYRNDDGAFLGYVPVYST